MCLTVQLTAHVNVKIYKIRLLYVNIFVICIPLNFFVDIVIPMIISDKDEWVGRHLPLKMYKD